MIREYKDTDFEDVAVLNRISYECPCDDSALQSKLGRASCWVCEIGGSVIGAAIVLLMGYKDQPVIWSITVTPAQQNKGWGSALIRETSKHFRELWLYVDTGSPAKNLYLREGFQIEQLLWNHYGTNQHAYLMRKACLG